MCVQTSKFFSVSVMVSKQCFLLCSDKMDIYWDSWSSFGEAFEVNDFQNQQLKESTINFLIKE